MLGSKIQFKTFDESGEFVINNRAERPTLHASNPFFYISVLAVDGLDSADISYESHPIPNVTGEKSGDVFRRGKGIALSGEITALSVGALEDGADYLGQMFWDTRIRKLLWTPYNAGFQVYLMVRVNQDVSVARTPNPNYTWPWTVGLRADDPRIRKESDDSVYPSWRT